MASQLAPRGQLEVQLEAAREQFALLENEGRRREIGGSGHRTGFIVGLLKFLIHMTD